MALFANFAEKPPSNYGWDHERLHGGWPFCEKLFKAFKPNQFGNKMPAAYFMFLETHWGGGGCYAQTGGRHTKSLVGALSAAIGFR